MAGLSYYGYIPLHECYNSSYLYSPKIFSIIFSIRLAVSPYGLGEPFNSKVFNIISSVSFRFVSLIDYHKHIYVSIAFPLNNCIFNSAVDVFLTLLLYCSSESFLYTLNRSRDWHKKIPQVNLDYYWLASW